MVLIKEIEILLGFIAREDIIAISVAGRLTINRYVTLEQWNMISSITSLITSSWHSVE